MINRMKELNNRYYIFSRFSSKFLRNNIFGGGEKQLLIYMHSASLSHGVQGSLHNR